jgi:hypothetical protein
MKTFSILTIFSFCLVFSVQAQDNQYVPNARQAIQKSRMQQPQYLELTKDTVDKQQNRVETPAPKNAVNYQFERPVAMDAPKRRGKKSGESAFAKLASNSKK